MTKENVIETDVLVIGGGMAGLFAAIKAREEGTNVVLVDKNYVSRSGTTCYCDGDFSVCNPEWGHKLENWKKLITQRGEYLNDPEWTEITLKDSLERYKDLLSWGVKPPMNEKGEIVYFAYPNMPRNEMSPVNLHRGSDYLPIMRRHAVKTGVRIADKIMVTELLKQDGSVAGAVGFSLWTGEFYVFKAKATVISAGSGNFRPMSFASSLAFGSFDGDTMAYRAGAEMRNMEFTRNCRWGHTVRKWTEKERVSLEGKEIHTKMAEYPQTAYYPSPMLMIGNLVDTEGYGNGAQFRGDELLVIHEGKGPLMVDYDNVPQELWDWANNAFPTDMEHFKKVGLDPRHATGLWNGMVHHDYGIGQAWGGSAGIASTDTKGGTSLPGLYAAGDSYHSTAIGAAYPGMGNGTRNAAVTGAIAGRSAAAYAKRVKTVKPDNLKAARSYTFAPLERKGGFDTTWSNQQIQNNTLPYFILCIRHADRLKAALANIEFLQNHIAPMIYARDYHDLRSAHEAKNRIMAAEMILRSSLFRKESRGAYYREDYPNRIDSDWLAWTRLKNVNGEMKLSKNTLPRKIWAEKIASIPYQEKYPSRNRGEKV
ncbi:MAG: FAD-binding protein [Dehalococcoidales bacterium]|nr:FAD-binding protein [Dehalococcoidales bacterium]